MNLSTDSPTRRSDTTAAVRTALLDAAMVEFATHGFEGASTRAIAQRAGAHQPQINYHFDSKESLWFAVFEQLLGELDALIAAAVADEAADDGRGQMAAVIRSLVHFAAERPELNRIMIHEGTSDSPRLKRIVDEHIRRRAENLVAAWAVLVDKGQAVAIPSIFVYHLLLGSSTLLHANAPEFRLLFDTDPSNASTVAAHADALVSLFLPTKESP